MNRASTLVNVAGALFLLSLLVPSALASPPEQLNVQIVANSPVFAGQTVEIAAVVQLANGTVVGSKATLGGHIYYPNGTAINLPVPTGVGVYVKWVYIVPNNAPDGLYAITISASLAKFNSSWGLGSFTVNSQLASKAGVTSVMTQLTSMSTQLGTLTTNIAALSSEIKGNFSAVLSQLSTEFGTLTSTLNAVSTAQTNIQTTLKANFTTAIGDISNDYGLLTNMLNDGFGGVHTSFKGLSSDLSGNFTAMTAQLNNMKAALGTLATAGQITLLNGSLNSAFQGVNTGLGQLATSAQANSLMTSLQSLSNQLTLSTEIQDFFLLPVAIFILVLFAWVFLRKPKK